MKSKEKKAHAAATVRIVVAVAEAIRELKEVPCGHLYARVMQFLSLEEYNAVLAIMQRQGWIEISGHLITWTGPAKGETNPAAGGTNRPQDETNPAAGETVPAAGPAQVPEAQAITGQI